MKIKARPRGRTAASSLAYLGNLIRAGRIARRENMEQFAARVGISRGLLHRIEQGDPGCAVGVVFETASLGSGSF